MGKILQRIFPDFLRDFSQFDKYRYCRLSSDNQGLKNRMWIWRAEQPEENLKNRRKYRRYFGIFTDISENFPIFPTSPARVQDTKSGSKIVDLGFVKFKSNGTTAKRPLKQIQKTQGAKEKQIFWFSLGVLNGFSRKSNEDEFSRKSNGGWIFLGIKRGLQKK